MDGRKFTVYHYRKDDRPLCGKVKYRTNRLVTAKDDVDCPKCIREMLKMDKDELLSNPDLQMSEKSRKLLGLPPRKLIPMAPQPEAN